MGENAAANGEHHQLSPVSISPENGYNYEGTILRATAAGWQQHVLLTTAGLYAWGNNVRNSIIFKANVTSSREFSKISTITNANDYGLPHGVNPEDVKMLFSTPQGLAIVTCSGAGYVITYSTNWAIHQSGDTIPLDNQRMWHRVSTAADQPLENVVAIRGHHQVFLALTSDGKLYTWGRYTYLGDGSGVSSRQYATEMAALPGNVKPKMIAMTNSNAAVSYHVVGMDGKVYGLGSNIFGQLGDRTTTDRNSWVTVKKPDDSELDNVAWMSVNESYLVPVVQVLTRDGKLWSWGINNSSMIGSSSDLTDPTMMVGELDPNTTVIAVETGGHTNTIFTACSNQLMYIGHEVNGSYGNGIGSSNPHDTWQSGPAFSGLCGVPLPQTPEVENLQLCDNQTVDLAQALLNAPDPNFYTVEWWTTPTREEGIQVTDPTAAIDGTYYVFYLSTLDEGNCYNSEAVEVLVEYVECCFNDPNIAAGISNETPVGISLLKRAVDDQDNWPMLRNSGFIALESNSQGFVVTRLNETQINSLIDPQEGMMVYDTTNKCLKIYSDDGWSCFKTPTCP